MFNFTDLQQQQDLEEEESSVLLSIGDLMSGLLMIFALLFVTVLVQLKDREEPRRVVIGTVVEEMKGNNINVEVNPETGEVSIQDKILFDENSAELKPAGKIFLQQFIPVYSRVIFSKKDFEKEIARVVIEGHTSSKGDYNSNLQLSLLRSLSVAKFIFSNELDFSTKSELRTKIMAAGRGEMEAKQEQDEPNDRKVIFRFQFRGENFSEWYQKNQSLPEQKP
ncbi:flagellar motor protein MotB [Aerosakkonemataceae cyanobacterium BLCC-F50]|uniref:Flagellar motor protein MotB n=1 Tax=Floridaenema flaviceps BLCC-F50 TaxID=3153642 RepID=A0ABV4XWX4_9CYAN